MPRRQADMDEELDERHPRLTRGLRVPRRRQLLLRITLKWPVMSGYEGPAWKRFTCLDVFLGGEQIKSLRLPVKDDDVKKWKATMEYFMGLSWRDLSVGLQAVRADSFIHQATRRVVVLRAGEPHTSRHTAMIGAARVPLLDALVLGDDDDSDGPDERAEGKRMEKKRRPNRQRKLAEGTRTFYERVKLQGWRPGEAGGDPTNVVCGTVVVKLRLTEYDDLPGDDLHG